MTITDGVVGFTDKFSGNRTAEAIKRAFTFLLPVFIIGALSLTLQYFPSLPNTWKRNGKEIFCLVWAVTFCKAIYIIRIRT